MFSTVELIAGVLAASGVSAAASGPAAATIEFNLPAQDLDLSLSALAARAGYRAVFASALTNGRQAPALRGRMTLDDALRRLLTGSGLTYRIADGRLIVIQPAPSPTPPPSPETAPADRTPGFPPSADVDTVIVVGRPAPALTLESLGARELQSPELHDLADVARPVASLSASPSGPGLVRLSIRGVYGAGDAAVPVTLDETPLSGPAGTASDAGLFDPELDLVDVSRIEVFKGPQGAGGGVTSIAGRVAIRPAPAQLAQREVAATVSAALTADGAASSTLVGVANLPAGDDTAFRAVAYRRIIGGYVDNPALSANNTNRGEVEGVRLTVRHRVTERLEVSIIALAQDRHASDGASWNSQLPAYESSRRLLTPSRKSLRLVQAHVALTAAGQDLTLDSAAYRLQLDRTFDYSRILGMGARDPEGCARFFQVAALPGCDPAQTLQFAGFVDDRLPARLHHNGRVDVVFQQASATAPAQPWGVLTYGAYFETRDERYASEVVSIQPVTTPVVGRRELQSNYRQLAFFAEDRWQTGFLRNSLGLRYSDIQRTTTSLVVVPNLVSGLVDSVPGQRMDDMGLSARVRTEAQLAGRSLYAQASQAWRPGGINTVPIPSPQTAAFGRDTITSYELGGAYRSRGGRLQITGAAYVGLWTDMQFRATTPNGSFAYVFNAGDARIRGAELQVAAQPTRAWSLRASLAYTDAELRRVRRAATASDAIQPGDALPEVPRLKGFASAAYVRDLPGNLDLETVLQASARSAIHSEFSRASPFYVRSPGYLTLDLSIALKSASWMTSLDIRNLANSVAIERSIAVVEAADQVFSAPPRSVSLSVRRVF